MAPYNYGDSNNRLARYFAQLDQRNRAQRRSPSAETVHEESTRPPIGGDRLNCKHHGPYILAAEDAVSPSEDPAAEKIHESYPTCPTCVNVLAAKWGIE